MTEETTQPKARGKKAGGTLMQKLARVTSMLALVALVVVAAMLFFTEYVRPYEVGIKESKFGGGIKPDILTGGRIYFTGPGVTVYRFPAYIQSLQMSLSNASGSHGISDLRTIPAIEIDTSDGSKVKVDVTILYHISDAYKLITGIGKGRLYEDSAMIPKATAILKKNLGQLLAEDFYNEVKRLEHTAQARIELNTSLESKGLQVDDILIRQYYYERGYQKQIETRKVEDQLVFTNEAKGQSAKEDARKRRIIAEGEAAVAVEQRRGEAELVRIGAEADLYARKQRAEGDLLVSMAKAQGTELENKAYEGVGSPNLVAERMAKVLDGIEVIVVPSSGKGSINPLDTEAMMQAFGAR